MIRACVNPLNTDDHNGPGGDQFCIFCLRKRGDDALMMVAELRNAVIFTAAWNGTAEERMRIARDAASKAEALLA